mmetsp:Transcript_26939/g.58849  ORF Transcript_26939/g.58849 Transcript_26939/m.58849 type:complete len:149 (+) Transcript_26939:340-786(+)
MIFIRALLPLTACHGLTYGITATICSSAGITSGQTAETGSRVWTLPDPAVQVSGMSPTVKVYLVNIRMNPRFLNHLPNRDGPSQIPHNTETILMAAALWGSVVVRRNLLGCRPSHQLPLPSGLDLAELVLNGGGGDALGPLNGQAQRT